MKRIISDESRNAIVKWPLSLPLLEDKQFPMNIWPGLLSITEIRMCPILSLL